MCIFVPTAQVRPTYIDVLVEGGEAEMVTDVKGGLGGYKISPDGKTIAYAGFEPPPDLEKAHKEKRDFRVVDADPENFALYTIAAEANDEGKREAKRVFEAKYHVASFDWSS